MIPGHACSILCLNGTHVDLIHVSQGVVDLVDPSRYIASEFVRIYRVRVVQVRREYEAPRAHEIPSDPDMCSITVVGSNHAPAIEPFSVRWEATKESDRLAERPPQPRWQGQRRRRTSVLEVPFQPGSDAAQLQAWRKQRMGD